MAETVAQIEQGLIDNLQADPVLYDPTNAVVTKRGLISTSKVSLWRHYLNIIAIALGLESQARDLFKEDIEIIIANTTSPTASWWAAKVREFQYDALVTQVVQLNANFAPYYPVVNPLLRIITQVSIISPASKQIQVKVAKSSPPTPLSGSEIAALQSYLDIITPADIAPNIVTLDADKLWIVGTVYYNGAYQGIIQASVIAALNDFCINLPFDGVIKVSAIEDAIQAVPGVTDVVITSTALRADITLFANKTLFARIITSFAGYVVQETTASQTFADTLTFTVG